MVNASNCKLLACCNKRITPCPASFWPSNPVDGTCWDAGKPEYDRSILFRNGSPPRNESELHAVMTRCANLHGKSKCMKPPEPLLLISYAPGNLEAMQPPLH